MNPTIIIDTREQRRTHYDFDCLSEVHKLDSGDYSLKGYEDVVSVERKELNDLIQCIVPPKQRFFDELKRLCPKPFTCIVVEGDRSRIYNRDYNSGASPESIDGMVTSIIVDYNIPVYMFNNRQEARKFTEDYLCRVWRKLTKDERNENND